MNGKNIFIYNNAELQKYIDQYNGKRDFAISVYFFEQESGSPRERHESAIFDSIFFDIDSETYDGARDDVVNLHEKWLKVHGIKAQIFFSGMKGFHVIIPFKPFKSKLMKKILKRIQKNITEQVGLKFVDPRVWGDLARILRVPMTIHTKSGLYCRPVSYENVVWLSKKEMYELAKKPGELTEENNRQVIAEQNTDSMHFLLKRAEEEVEKEMLDFQREVRVGKIKMPEFGIEACVGVREAMKGVGVGKRDDVLCGLISYFRASGATKYIAKKKLLTFLGRCSGNIDDLVAQLDYKIDYHYDSKYTPCSFLTRSGLCEKCNMKRYYE